MSEKKHCYHCGEKIETEKIIFDEKIFCCNGCRSVYEILNLNDLTNFYHLNKNSGIKPENHSIYFDYLDSPEIFEKLIDFSEGNTTLITLKIPVIHCSSCIWLLESLRNLNPNIHYTQVNFIRKTLQISFDHTQMKLSELAQFLTHLGYKPTINLESSQKKIDTIDRELLIKMAIAGFAFGNGMFFSFPEYAQEILGTSDFWMNQYKYLFRWLMFALATPVVFYSASYYFKSAFNALKNRVINIDIPMALGIFVLYARSVYEILTDYGAGYFDTLCGLVFFMLVGRFFQKRTYASLSYDRDYQSFYPIAVTKIENGETKDTLISEIKIGDRILVRNQEIIPMDSILIRGEGRIDNSFITGESSLISKNIGDKIYAGGRQMGQIIELEVIKNVNQSYLTQLWNKDNFTSEHKSFETLITKISRYFIIFILSISILAGIFWAFIDMEKMFQVVCAILIIACPCALALSTPFTLGHIMRIMGRKKFYAKDSITIEKLSKINTLVFDKTGTITENKKTQITYHGEEISTLDLQNIKSLAKNSNHPLSRALFQFLKVEESPIPLDLFEDFTGKGYVGVFEKNRYQIGSASFVGASEKTEETVVYVAKNERILGKFSFKNKYRDGLSQMFSSLKKYEIYILSGDNNAEEKKLREIAPNIKDFKFNQSPEDKLNFIKKLQENGKNIAMLGDGLNDAGALKQSQIGIAIAEDNNAFTPSSDIIMHGEELPGLHQFLTLSHRAMKIIKTLLTISLIYNIIGISLAVMGKMSPLMAAILMPISSITVVSFTALASYRAKKITFKK